MLENEDSAAQAAAITAAWLANPHTRSTADDAAQMLRAMHAAVRGMANAPSDGGDADVAATTHTPAISVRKSLASREHIISMIDGKPYRALRRHLTANGLTPDAYRARYGLKPDYPMVAPAYSEARSATAKKSGLGRKPKDAAEAAPAKAKRTAPAKKRGVAAAKAAARAHLGG